MPPKPLPTVKAEVDAEFPTPTPVWISLRHDARQHLPSEAAEFRATFNNRKYVFYSSCERTGETDLRWYIGEERGPQLRGQRQMHVVGAATWAVAKTVFTPLWEAICEEERDRIALRRYASDVMDEPERAQDARVANVVLSLGFGAFAPAFDEDVLDYVLTATTDRLRLDATKKFDGQSYYWTDEKLGSRDGPFGVTVPGGGAGVTLLTVTLLVTAEDGETTGVYTFEIQR